MKVFLYLLLCVFALACESEEDDVIDLTQEPCFESCQDKGWCTPVYVYDNIGLPECFPSMEEDCSVACRKWGKCGYMSYGHLLYGSTPTSFFEQHFNEQLKYEIRSKGMGILEANGSSDNLLYRVGICYAVSDRDCQNRECYSDFDCAQVAISVDIGGVCGSPD